MDILTIITIILNIAFLIISLYLLILFIKCEGLHNYPCYNSMIISLIILIDNAFRLVPTKNYPEPIKYIQASTLTFLDKLLLTTITSQTIILSLGIVKAPFYYKYEKTIFFSTFIISIVICSLLTSLYILIGGIKNHEEINHYYYGGFNKFNDIADPIFDSILLLINIYFFMNLLIYVFKKMKQASNDEIDDYSDFGKNFTKYLLIFIVNCFAFTISYLIIFYIIPLEIIDIIYLFYCLIIDLVYNINEATKEGTREIFCINRRRLSENPRIELYEEI